MNQFHELNVLTSRGELNSALSLIKKHSEGVVRKIMKKAGYTVPELYGRSFWLYVQNTILKAARNFSDGYSAAFKHPSPATENVRVDRLNDIHNDPGSQDSTGEIEIANPDKVSY